MPSTTFAALGVPADVASRLAARGITEPFPIQEATLPDAIAGRDVCGKAPTGSGKTLAFGIPLVTRIRRAQPRKPHGLVLVPTRELASQVRDELVELVGPKGLRVLTVFGGVGMGPQVQALQRGVDVLVACPGRLADLVNQREVDLSQVELVVLDEADRMADMGFLPEVKRLLDKVKADRQTLLFSATLDGDVDVLIKRYQRNPARHEVVKEEDAPENRHLFWRAERSERLELTAAIVNAEWPSIVFTRTKHGADRLTKQLNKVGVAAVAIHGDRSQAQRERALAAFASGKAQALVATDVAARGIHVDDVASVVHFDPAADEKDYTHRSGRTGRAGAAGVVVTLVPMESHKSIKLMQRKLQLPPGIDPVDLSVLSTGGSRPTPRPIQPAPKPQPKDRQGRPSQGAPRSGDRRPAGAPKAKAGAPQQRRRSSGPRRSGR
jgi:superfamily II DNA/RNA helicase